MKLRNGKYIYKNNNIPDNLWLILDLNKLTIKDLSYIKIQSPSVYRDDIPPLEEWYKIDFNKLTNYDIQIIKIDFPELFIKIIKKYRKFCKKRV
tara:strand:- start:8625 stop:8906 length:282 start_codon:yes stop_codon:yes gene_type:complete